MSAVLKEVAASAAAPRHNIYQVIHKALRAFMADTLLRIGSMDISDDAERAEAIAQLRGLLAMCDSHLRHENEFVHTAIEKARPHATARTVEDHRHHEDGTPDHAGAEPVFESQRIRRGELHAHDRRGNGEPRRADLCL
jgi:hypothetical protein